MNRGRVLASRIQTESEIPICFRILRIETQRSARLRNGIVWIVRTVENIGQPAVGPGKTGFGPLRFLVFIQGIIPIPLLLAR